MFFGRQLLVKSAQYQTSKSSFECKNDGPPILIGSRAVSQNQFLQDTHLSDWTTFHKPHLWTDQDIERLLHENEELRKENHLLRQEIAKLRLQLEQKDQKLQEQEKLLNQLQNTNVPPSAQHSPFGPKIPRSPVIKAHSSQNEKPKQSKPGRPKGTEGVIRPQRPPDKVVELSLDQCPHCLHALTPNDIVSTTSRVIEEIPDPQPVTVIEYKIPVYHCSQCNHKTQAASPETSQPGIFGPCVHTKVVMNSIVRRLPVRKVCEALKDDFQLDICPASIITLENRVASTFKDLYHSLLDRVADLSVVNIDETSFPVNGENWWVWEFTTPEFCTYVIHPSRGQATLQTVIGSAFKGTAITDRWLVYCAKFFPFPHIQFCWAHLTRKFEAAVGEGQEAVACLAELRQLYHWAKESVAEDPPPEKREELWIEADLALMDLINKYSIAGSANRSTNPLSSKLQKALQYTINGFPNWFTFVLKPGVDPTNNRAERDLREVVILRKIKECLRSETSVETLEILLSIIKTARLQHIPLEKFIYDAITGQSIPQFSLSSQN